MPSANRSRRLLGAMLMLTACLSVQGAWGTPPTGQQDEEQSDSPLGDLLANCPPPLNPEATPPRCPWYARTEGVFLLRDASHATDFAALGTPTNIVLSTRDLDFPFKAGGRALIGHTINPWNQIEFSYMAVEHWRDAQVVRDETANDQGAFGNLSSPFTHFGTFGTPPLPVVGLDYNNSVSIDFKSKFETAELNWRHYLDMPPGRLTTSLLFGVRWMAIRENFEYQSFSAVPTVPPPGSGSQDTVHTDTANNLLGVQLGATLEFYSEGPWWVNFEIKGALCQNEVEETTLFRQTLNGVVQPDYLNHRERYGTTWLGDLALTVVYRFGPHMNARFGYQALFVDGVALADVNVLQQDINPRTLTVLGPGQVHQSSNVVYHGPFAGLELAW